jgi:predicted esterase YcpF (UPF0227 family)
MDNSYIKTFPDLMSEKKILYVHGFASSGQSGTVTRIRTVLPSAEVIAPDLPLHPQEALDLLRATCEQEKPDLIIGTSMGGMYTEMLYGYDRIIVNPAFEMGDTMLSHNMVGAQHYQNPRRDGVQDFMVTKALVKEYKDMTEQCFGGVNEKERDEHVIGLFGDRDETVNTFDLFHAHYPRAIRFHGEHRMNDDSFMHSVLPVIRWFDDWQEGRERSVIYIATDSLIDSYGKPRASAQKAFRRLLETYHLFIVAPSPADNPQAFADVQAWAQEYINVPAYNHVIFTNQLNLLYGDYLISGSAKDGASDFMGTRIPFGDDTFKTWEEVITYFDRLGGQ